MAALDFNATEADPNAPNRDTLPEGRYRCVITDSQSKETNAKKEGRAREGEYLETTLQVVDGEHKGRLVWARFNTKNDSAAAQNIGRQQLSQLCHAVNVMSPRDSAQLHNIPFIAEVKCRKRKDNGEMTNEVKTFHAMTHSPGKPAEANAAPYARNSKPDFPDGEVPF